MLKGKEIVGYIVSLDDACVLLKDMLNHPEKYDIDMSKRLYVVINDMYSHEDYKRLMEDDNIVVDFTIYEEGTDLSYEFVIESNNISYSIPFSDFLEYVLEYDNYCVDQESISSIEPTIIVYNFAS